MRKLSKILGLGAALAAGVITYAAVTFDPESGLGFVGKGDVQLALGWNNAQLQANANNLSFTYTDAVEYDVPCMKIIETKKETTINRNTFNRERSITGVVAYDARKKNQITGFTLLGYDQDSLVVDGTIGCPGGWEPDGEPVLVGASGGVLSVNGVALGATPEPVVP